jgi:hypothetical protein
VRHQPLLREAISHAPFDFWFRTSEKIVTHLFPYNVGG